MFTNLVHYFGMKKKNLVGLAIASILPLTGCGSGDGYALGEWELEAWTEVDGRSGKFEPRSDTIQLDSRMASLDPRTITFSKFYRGEQATDVVFADGVISGHINQGAVAPFSAHEQTVTGWYKRDGFEMRIAMPEIAGIKSYQVVTGKLVEPLAED